jgi:tetratricopeptide (TPR) repeat protein
MNNTLTSTISQHISKLKTPLIASALCLVLHQDHPIENQAPNQDKISTHTSISHIPNKAQADSLQDQALALYYTRDYTPAMQKYLQALDIYIILQDHKNIYYCNLDIGKILFESQNYNQAIHYFEQAYLHVHKTTYIRGEAISLIRTMRIHNMTNHPKQSYQYYQKGLAIFEQLKQQNKLSDPDLYGRYIEFLSHATYITKETNHEADYLYISQEFARISTKNMTPNDLGPYYIRLGDMKIAKKDYTTALRYYTQVTNNPKIDSGIVSGGLYGKSMAYEGLKDYKQALEYYKLYTKYQSKVTNTQAQKEKVEVEAKHTTEKHELQLTKQKLELENKNIIIATKTKETKHLLYGLFTSLLALSTLIFLRDKMRKAKLLANKEKSISDKTKQEIELQNQFIQESLHYGYNIQQSILPKKEEIETLFNKHIMIFQPRDIVSGDFYRVKKTKQENVFAQIDYTGHGIPGALLSTFGYYFFEEAIKKGKKTPADILNFIDKHFNETLYKKGRKETAEMMLISHNPSQGTITYAGA